MTLASWMGTDFPKDDLVRQSSFIDDYAHQLAGRSNDPAGWEVRFDAKPGLVGLWNRIELVVSADDMIPLQARYYDRKNRLARTMHWDEVRELDGRRLPVHMALVPEDEPGNRTEMRYQAIRFNVDVPESTFSLSNLEQQR
jgi:outer membrane lipoprotein-sorting protein